MILALALLLAVVVWVCYAVARALDASLEEADRQASAVLANDRRSAFTMSLSQVTEGEKGRGGFQEPIRLPVCCLFSMSSMGSQPRYRFGEEPGK